MDHYFGGSSGDMLADKRYAMALEFAREGDHAAAADLLRQGIEFAPHWPPFYFQLGEALRQAGDKDAAAAAFRDYLARDPADAMGASVKLSLIGAAPVPETMPEEYVRSLFHQYAPKFEKSLVENLQYHTPDLMAEMVAAHHAGAFAHLLDLGCGTGLAAQHYAGRAAKMTGIDLAPGMIDAARAKNLYDDLHVAGIDEFLKDTPEHYDLVLAADVFVYVGALEKTFERIAHAMTKGGLFCFSVQTPPDDSAGFTLGTDHRYAHPRAYIEHCAAAAHFSMVDVRENVTLRLDAGKPVTGALYLLKSA